MKGASPVGWLDGGVGGSARKEQDDVDYIKRFRNCRVFQSPRVASVSFPSCMGTIPGNGTLGGIL